MQHETLFSIIGSKNFDFKPVNQVEAVMGERAIPVKHRDNLMILEGSFEGRRAEAAYTKGERAVVQRYQDNLKYVRRMLL